MITTIGSAVVIMYIGIALLNKLLGKAETVLQKIALSPEEEAIHRKMSKWQTIPHLVGGIGFLAALFLVPRTSPYYPYIHPLTMAAPALIGLLVASIYRKPLAKFTKKTVDPDLTWFARDIGKQVGFRVQDVYVVESSRAAQVAEFSMEQGNNIIVTQKFKEIMTPQEAGFLLTSRLIQQRTNNQKSPGLVFIVPLLVIAIVLLSGGVLHSMSPTALLGVFARVVPISIASTSTLVILSILNTKRMQGTVTKKAIEADQQALAIQGGAIAARMALAKMMMHSPYRDPASAAQTANPLFTYPQRLAALKEYENSEVLRS